jgi:prepilin-type N-terminal cleavage/methylation domain-containing protein
MLQTFQYKKESGFSLVELSIVIVITSLLLTSIITLSPQQEAEDLVKITNQKLDRIEMAIRAHQMLKGRLPCPARRLEALTSSLLGVETDCTVLISGFNATVNDVASGADYVRLGSVPVKELGLSDEDTYDAWGNRITYAIIRQLATSAANYDAYTTATTRVITIIGSAGTAINAANPEQVAYVLISHGKDGLGSFNRTYTGASSVIVACGSNNDTENCDEDTSFRAQNANYNGGGAYYDDIVRWKGKSALTQEGGYHTWGAAPTPQYGKWQYTGSPPASAAGSAGWTTTFPNPVQVNDTLPNVSFSGVTFTLGSGRYVINVSMPVCGTNNVYTTIYNGTNLPGQAVNGDSTTGTAKGNCTRSYSTHYLEILPNQAAQNYSIRYNAATANITDGFGRTGTCCYPSGYVNAEILQLDR